MANQYTLVAGDVQYLSHYLTVTDPITDVTSYENYLTATTINFRMRINGSTVTAVNTTGIIATDDSGVKFVRTLVTIPLDVAKYDSEVEVWYDDGQHITWKGNTYYVVQQLG